MATLKLFCSSNKFFSRRRRNAISSSWSYLKKIFTKPCMAGLDAQLKAEEAEEAAAPATVCSGRCSMHSEIPVVTHLESDFPHRNDIFPCPACGEIFRKPHSLEQHQTLKHTVSEHIDGEIFQKPHSLE